jgi:hypothetical protein
MSTVSHPLLISELLGHDEEKLLSRQLKKKGTPTIDEFPERLQWMVFKVKQRAKRDYFTMIDGRTPIMPFYTYNWPYDYFSLVELAKIDTEVSFEMTARGKAYFTKHAGASFAAEGRSVPVDKGADEVDAPKMPRGAAGLHEIDAPKNPFDDPVPHGKDHLDVHRGCGDPPLNIAGAAFLDWADCMRAQGFSEDDINLAWRAFHDIENL